MEKQLLTADRRRVFNKSRQYLALTSGHINTHQSVYLIILNETKTSAKIPHNQTKMAISQHR